LRREVPLSAIGILLLASLPAACKDSTSPTPTAPESYGYELVSVYPQLELEYPVGVCAAAGTGERLFVVEQRGRIVMLDPADSSSASIFLDLSDRVGYEEYTELGLLGLAFRPDYESTHWFYVYYTYQDGSGWHSRLSRFTAEAGGLSVQAASEKVLMEFDEPYKNHNGGGMCFGEGTELYLGLGDGGYGGDPTGSAQDRTRYLGSILRIDVGGNENTAPYYAIPDDNPFVGNAEGYREEIFAYGLRNPWRISFDAARGELWAGEVGQSQWEEVDRIVKGGNYGWDCREGAHDYLGPPGGPSPQCATAGPFLDPLYEYDHSGGNASITGGYVVRADSLSALEGRYVFADFASGRIWALTHDGQQIEELLDAPFRISSFGLGADDALYVLEYSAQGKIHRLMQRAQTP
jgi:glucose/arabinose dehydrogenase